jgi:threonyl-tRNA synthetase
MYKTSGHLPYYAESMFPPMVVIESNIPELIRSRHHEITTAISDLEQRFVPTTLAFASKQSQIGLAGTVTNAENCIRYLVRKEGEGVQIPDNLKEMRNNARLWLAQLAALPIEPYYLKAMNCPHHHRIFAAEPRSYRDLPLRLAEYGTCYRYEQSGELLGLMRVRSLNMNDAHIYCTEEQFAQEFNAVNEMYLKYFKIFGIEKYQMRFSTHSTEGLGKKYVNEPALWLKTEEMVRKVLIESKINYVEVANEAAFYGPKIDVQVWSVIGREFTLATNQVDFAVPAKFGLTYRDRDNTDKTPLCIHRAPLGTHERFIGFLIEHYAGNFPLWLAPEQVRVMTIGEDAPLVAYGKAVTGELRARQVRAEGDFGSDKINGKIQRAEEAKVHTMLVIGPRDLEAGNVSVRIHGKGNQGAKPRGEVVAAILQSITERQA